MLRLTHASDQRGGVAVRGYEWMKIRKVKQYEPIETDVDSGDVQSDVDAGSRIQADTGWWSNARIIETIPDAKLRETYHRYRTLVTLCREELDRRKLLDIHVHASPAFNVSEGRYRYVPADTTYGTHKRPKRAPTKRSDEVSKRSARGVVGKPTRKQLTLTPEQISRALDMLVKLKQKDNNG